MRRIFASWCEAAGPQRQAWLESLAASSVVPLLLQSRDEIELNEEVEVFVL